MPTTTPPMVQVLQSVLVPAKAPMAQVPANASMAQAVQPAPANPQTVTDLLRPGTGTAINYEARATVTVLYATQYPKAVRQHHIYTIRLILSRRRFLELNSSLKLLTNDNSISANAEWVCNNVERALIHGVRVLEFSFSSIFSGGFFLSLFSLFFWGGAA